MLAQGRSARPILGRQIAFENNQEAMLRLGGNLEGNDANGYCFYLFVFYAHVLSYGFKALLPCFVDRALQLE